MKSVQNEPGESPACLRLHTEHEDRLYWVCWLDEVIQTSNTVCSGRNACMSLSSSWSAPPPQARAHLVGICGAGMKALAEFLFDSGWSVSGCDGDPDPASLHSLTRLGIDIQKGHSAAHLDGNPDLLIYSPAVNRENVDRAAAAGRGVQQISYVDALSQLSRRHQTVGIAGTHGKSTTTAMLGQILKTAGRPASVLCGGESVSAGRSGWAGSSDTLILEACEFRQHFLELSLRIGCLLGIEADHFDCYPTLPDAERAYQQFVRKILREKHTEALGEAPRHHLPRTLIVRSDCSVTSRILQEETGRITTFSLQDSTADWQAVQRRRMAGRLHFRIQRKAAVSEEISLAIPGLHNVQNALAAAACAEELGVSLQDIARGLREFSGLRRRFEIRGQWRGAVVVDDYAHHPTEIRATLTAAREHFPKKKLICLFQPHQLSRTEALLAEFAAALSLADKIYLLPVYAARENSGFRQIELSRDLVQRITIPASLISALDRVWGTVQTDADTDAVLLTLGAGSLSRIHYEDFERTE